MACYLEEDEFFLRKTGTLGYRPPEMILGQVSDFRSDVWSLGVILYQLLCGDMPFLGEGESIGQVEQNILNKELFKEPIWSTVSVSCKDLLVHMLSRDIELRYDIIDVLAHPWVAASF